MVAMDARVVPRMVIFAMNFEHINLTEFGFTMERTRSALIATRTHTLMSGAKEVVHWLNLQKASLLCRMLYPKSPRQNGGTNR